MPLEAPPQCVASRARSEASRGMVEDDRSCIDVLTQIARLTTGDPPMSAHTSSSGR